MTPESIVVLPDTLVDAVVRVLVADGLWAHRTGSHRFEAGRSGPGMEWHVVGDTMFGRAIGDVGEAAWKHVEPAGQTAAPADIARRVARTIRRVA